MHHRLRLCCHSFSTCIFLRSFWHHFRPFGTTEMANGKPTQKMIPFITCEFPLASTFASCFLGVNVFDLDFAVQIDQIEQPINRNSVSPGNMSHCRTPSFKNHVDYSLIVFKHVTKASWIEGIKSTLSKWLITHRDCSHWWIVWGQTTGLSVLSWF